MKITKTVIINKPADSVWKIIAHDFDQAHKWMGPVPHSYAISKEATNTTIPMEGRICHLSDNPKGAQAKEIITQYSESSQKLTFEVTPINVPAVVPLKKNVVEMSVKSLGENQTEVTWISRPQLKTPAYLLYPLLRLMLPLAFGKLLQGLKSYSESQSMQAVS